ncbi:MAG: hypothetical protein HYT93_03070 [Parcubacteria group bacterium]|nr:hypothetical protein [Parcubacteria group bacterium]
MSGTEKMTPFEMLKQAMRGAKKTTEVVTDAVEAGVREVKRALIEYNPLDLSLGDVALVRMDEYKESHFAVDAINVTARTISDERYLFADYLLVDRRGAKTDDDAVWLLLRIVPRGKHDSVVEGASSYLLVPQFECKYDKGAHGKLKRGKLPVDDVGGLSFARPGDIKEEHAAVVTEHTSDGKKESKIDYWDFIAETDEGLSLYVVEMDKETGWFQAYAGHEVDLKTIEFVRTGK